MALLTTWDSKDPDEILDYRVDWTARLAGDTILTSTWALPTGITKVTDSTDNVNTTTIWFSGGVDGKTYACTNHITTAGGRTMEQTINLPVVQK